MAPEVFLGKQYDEKCDVFSFGILVVVVTLETFVLPYGEVKSSHNIESKVPVNPKVAVFEEIMKIIEKERKLEIESDGSDKSTWNGMKGDVVNLKRELEKKERKIEVLEKELQKMKEEKSK